MNKLLNSGKLSYFATFTLTLIIFAVWNLPQTISLRYLCFFLLIVISVLSKVNIKDFVKLAWPVWLFLIYIIFHGLFLSSDWQKLLVFYWSDWLKFIILIFIGAVIGTTLAQRHCRNLLLWLSLALVVPSGIHIVLLIYKYFVNNTLEFGYWGINPHHEMFAYSAIPIFIFLISYIIFLGNKINNVVAVFILLISLFSNFFANSRGGVLFIVISGIITILIILLFTKNIRIYLNKLLIIFIATLITATGVYTYMDTINSTRWNIFESLEKIKISLISDPIKTICFGDEIVRQDLKKQNIVITPNIENIIYSISTGDASRIVVARAGIELLKVHPLGINGSRQAYQIAINQICNPKIIMAHTHNGWIDTALAIGIPGALLLLNILIYFGLFGYKNIHAKNNMQVYAICLLSFSIIWILRALLDSVQRTQMLEMQAIILSMLVAMLLKYKKTLP